MERSISRLVLNQTSILVKFQIYLADNLFCMRKVILKEGNVLFSEKSMLTID